MCIYVYIMLYIYVYVMLYIWIWNHHLSHNTFSVFTKQVGKKFQLFFLDYIIF